MDIGLGRQSRNDDSKGLPDGTVDSSLYELSFSFGLFKTKEVASSEYQSYFDKEENPIYVTKRDHIHEIKQDIGNSFLNSSVTD